VHLAGRKVADVFSDLVASTRYLPDRGAQHECFNAVIRGLMQVVAYTAIEVLTNKLDNLSQTEIPNLAQQLTRPTDGDLERVISTAAPLLREAGVDLQREWFHAGDAAQSLQRQAAAWCSYRNERVAHGVVAKDVREEALSWLPSLATGLLRGFEALMPEYVGGGHSVMRLEARGVTEFIEVPTVRWHEGAPILIRDIRQRGSFWQLRGQELDVSASAKVVLDFAESGLTTLLSSACSRYRQVTVRTPESTEWHPTVLLPRRQTETFEGRRQQVAELVRWLNDMDSRACNVHGDGGIGKTTLVLELLNRMIDGDLPEVEWSPDIICFFSAKVTRWGPDGLEYLRGVAPPIDEAVRTLAAVYEEPAGREWHSLSGERLVGRVETLLRDLGISRDQVLLVLDNTETMARSSGDERKLAEAIEYVTRRLARVLITSRRRERMEARPIEVPPLSQEEAQSLLLKLAECYEARPILQAGDRGRRKLVSSFGGHPIKIDACCRIIGRYGHSLERAQEQVLADRDLADFLYEDAWARINEEQRLALVTLAQLGDSLPGDVIQFVCGELRVDQSGVLEAFEETKFAVRFDYGTQFDIRLEASALRFLQAAFTRLRLADQDRVNAAAANAGRRRAELMRAHDSVVEDRISQAFGTDAAKAAWQAASRNQIDDAVFWYEEAIKVEPSNAQLLDRFAFFLASKVRDYERAALVAEEACKHDPTYGDAQFTAGHIAASRGDPDLADERLQAAQSLGVPEHRCDLQRARARLRQLDKEIQERDARPLDLTKRLRRAERLLRSASLPIIGDDRDRKHQYEVNQVLRQIRSMARRYGLPFEAISG
jgi:hypothetical protein